VKLSISCSSVGVSGPGMSVFPGGVISCMITITGSGRSGIVTKWPSIAAPSTTDAACEHGSTTGMLHTFANWHMSTTFCICDPERYSVRMDCLASFSLSMMCRVWSAIVSRVSVYLGARSCSKEF